MSDLHVGAPHVGLDQLRRIVQRTNAENPAVIVLLGDFVIGGPGGHGGVGNFVEPEQIADELKKLRAPFGVFAVLGNHDWWVDGEHVRRALTSAGIRVLENQAVRMGGDAHGPAFWLGGIGDLWTRHADIPGTLRQVDGDDPVVLITHNPDLFPEVPPRVSLTLAGHTHGGQVNLPLFGRVVTVSERGYGAGEIVEQGRHLFVTTGIGTSIIPVRFGVPPEIVILTVSQAKSR
ncbi:MAG: metallophosphoesterase [Bryobacterales bacterium]|nr:metallophosphoesterase [Bryobacterales bacterium]